MHKNNIICQNLWNAVKTVFRGKCIAVNAYTEKEKRPQSNLLFYHKKPEKKKKSKFNLKKQKEGHNKD